MNKGGYFDFIACLFGGAPDSATSATALVLPCLKALVDYCFAPALAFPTSNSLSHTLGLGTLLGLLLYLDLFLLAVTESLFAFFLAVLCEQNEGQIGQLQSAWVPGIGQ